MSLFGGTINALHNSLDYSNAKNKMIANNIANVDTPNYKAKKVEFKNTLQDELHKNFQAKRTDERHLSFSSHEKPYSIKTNQSTVYNHNGNNVDIDKEMTILAENQIYYQALTDRINGKFNSLQSVIRGGN